MGNVDHTSRKHALLSASGSHRWLMCTPSARLEEKFDESSSSSYAQEGTLAHELADLKLHLEFGTIDQKSYNKELRRLEKEILKFYGGADHELQDMHSHTEAYVVFCREVFNEIDSETNGQATVIIEERVDYSHLVEGGFGSNDFSVIGDNVLAIVDFKYGKGIKVEAKTNSQLMLYSSGALRKHEMSYDIERVRHMIFQPRLSHYSKWECSVSYLENWGEKIVKPRAELAYKGAGEKQAGDHCKFCKVKAMCKTLADKNLELARHEFEEPHLLELDQIVEIYKELPMLLDWANSVSKYLLDEAVKGTEIPEHKLVEGRSNRRWVDEASVALMLTNNGYSEDEIMQKKLKTLTQIEKILGKEKFTELLSTNVEKPVGKPTLVHESDKRPAMGIEQAKQDFS